MTSLPFFVCLRLPRRMTAGSVDLRRLTIGDGPFLKRLLADESVFGQRRSGAYKKASSLDLWWWARKEYICLYTIRSGERRIGLVGLYGLDGVRSTEMTLVIREQGDRGKGYGSEAFRLFLRYLTRTPELQTIAIRIDPSDTRTLHFWEAMGFRPTGQGEVFSVLTRDVSPPISAPPEGGSSYPSEQHRR